MKLNKIGKVIVVVLIGAMTIIGLSNVIFLVPDNSGNTDTKNEDVNNNALLNPKMDKVNIKTSDDVNVVGNYYQPSGEIKGWVLYLHMMPATKESYSNLATRLQRVGYAGLAIDLRGHGESENGPDGYKSFSNEEHQNSIEDVISSIEFLKSHGAKEDKISIIGASIGANLAIQYSSQNNEIEKIVALSPGINYHGIITIDLVNKFSDAQSLFMIGSEDDSNVPGNVSEILSIEASYSYKDSVNVRIFEEGEHGTDIMESHQELEDEVVAFIVS